MANSVLDLGDSRLQLDFRDLIGAPLQSLATERLMFSAIAALDHTVELSVDLEASAGEEPRGPPSPGSPPRAT
jgi:hypothetical protein